MTTINTAQDLSKSLDTFRATLPPDQKKALDAMLISFGRQAMRSELPTGQGLFERPDAARSMESLRMSLPTLADEGDLMAITPTVTTITITTTIASHKVIGCS
jgi:hypothetical protein